MKNKLCVSVVSLALLFAGSLHAQTFAISDTVTETVGTTAVITGGGTKDNTTTWSTGVVGTFQLNNGGYYLRVSATNPTGGLSAGTDSLMVARTVNSQGLTDQGTLSVYVNTGSNWSLDLTFDFFSDSSFTTPANIDLLLTSLDIDNGQRYYTRTTDFSTVTLYANTQITAATPVSGYNGYTATGDSSFNNPRYAVSSYGAGRSSFDVQIANSGTVALYMFEFRDPSAIVPEPATAALVGMSGLLLAARRRPRTI